MMFCIEKETNEYSFVLINAYALVIVDIFQLYRKISKQAAVYIPYRAKRFFILPRTIIYKYKIRGDLSSIGWRKKSTLKYGLKI